MTRPEDDLSYWLRGAEQEAITAIVVDGKAGSEAHREMSRYYSDSQFTALLRAAPASSSPIDPLPQFLAGLEEGHAFR